MLVDSTLLAAHCGNSGPFVQWLNDLGLGDFLKRYPLETLVDWGWVVPQYRVVFPREFFDTWEHYPCVGHECPAHLEQYGLLWSYYWWIDSDEDPYWYLDPIFRPGNESGELLSKFKYSSDIVRPERFKHARGHEIAPYADYFYPWQGYALVDLIRHADSIEPIYTTPDIADRSRGLLRIVNRIVEEGHDRNWPLGLLTAPKRWGGRAMLFTWLDYYRRFQEAVSHSHRIDDDDKQAFLQRGAKELAAYFSLTDTILGDEIKNRMLVLADEWMSANKRQDRKSHWTNLPSRHFQADLELAMSWLIKISGKSFQDYAAEWRLPYMGNWGWAPLDKALPYESLTHRTNFIRLVPYYFKQTPAITKRWLSLNKDALTVIVSTLCESNYPFSSFLAAFYEFHEHLGGKPFKEYGLDFRMRRPIDNFALLAIRVESCLRREMDSLGLLSQLHPDKEGLFTYIQQLAKAKGIPQEIVGTYCSASPLAGLKTDRADPIGRIQALRSNLSAANHQLVQSFLCCQLARNYFAHHDFLDDELVYSENAAFLMRGIITTVLVLLQRPSPEQAA